MNKPLLIGLGVAGVALAGGVGYALYKRSKAATTATAFPPMPSKADPRFMAPSSAAPGAPGAPAVANQIFWADKANMTRTATSMADLRAQLVREYGSIANARLANVFIPGDKRAPAGGAWLPASFYVFPMYAPDGQPLKSASQLAQLTSGTKHVPRAYAHAAGWTADYALYRRNGLGGAQMVSGFGGR